MDNILSRYLQLAEFKMAWLLQSRCVVLVGVKVEFSAIYKGGMRLPFLARTIAILDVVVVDTLSDVKKQIVFEFPEK